MDTDYVMARFGKKRDTARRGYQRFVEEGMGKGRVPELIGGGLVRSLGGWPEVMALRRKGEGEESEERILGGGDFVQAVLGEVEERQLGQLRARRKGATMRDIIEEECGRAGVIEKELIHGSWRSSVSGVREVIVHRCAEEIRLSAAEIARQLRVTTSSITGAIERVEEKRRK